MTVQGSFEDIRSQIRELRKIGEGPYIQSQGPGGIGSKTARTALQEAREAESNLLTSMEKQGLGKEAKEYREALGQYGKDKEVIRFVKGLQAQRALPGGANPQNRPGLAEAAKKAQPSSSAIQ